MKVTMYRTKDPKSLKNKIRPHERVQHRTSKELSRQRQNNLSAVDWRHWKETTVPKQTIQPLGITKSGKNTGKIHQSDETEPSTTSKNRELRTILFKEGEFAPNIGAGLLGPHNPLHELPGRNPKMRDKYSNWAKKSKGKAIKAKKEEQDSQTAPSKQLTLLYLHRSTQRDLGPMKAGNDILGLQRLSPSLETKGCIAKKAQEPVVKVTQSAGGTGQIRTGLMPMLTSRPRLTWWEQMTWTNEPPRTKVESWHYKPPIKPLTQPAQIMQGHQKHEGRSPV